MQDQNTIGWTDFSHNATCKLSSFMMEFGIHWKFWFKMSITVHCDIIMQSKGYARRGLSEARLTEARAHALVRSCLSEARTP